MKMATENIFAMSSGSEEMEILLQTMQKIMPIQNGCNLQNTDKLDSCPSSLIGFCKTASKDVERYQTDIDQNLLDDQLEDDQLSTGKATSPQKALILLNDNVMEYAHGEAPHGEWMAKLRGRALTSIEFIHLQRPMLDQMIDQPESCRFFQRSKSSPTGHPPKGGSCVPKSSVLCSKGKSKTTESMNKTQKMSDVVSDVSISSIPVGVKCTPPSAGDTHTTEREVTLGLQDPAPRQSSTSGGRRRGRKNRTKTNRQSGDHRHAVYAFAEALPPAAQTLNIQSLGRSEKCWREVEATVRCYHLKEERFILRLLKLERLQYLTIEAEQKRTNSANAIFRARPAELVEGYHHRQGCDQPSADRKRSSGGASSRPASAYSCRDSVHLRKEAVAGTARNNELNRGRSWHGISTKPNGRCAWLSAAESKAVSTLL